MRLLVTAAALSALCACAPADTKPSATPLSPDGARHEAMSYSRDGKRIAYWAPTSDGAVGWQLWVANADLSSPTKLPVTITTNFGTAPALWSPDDTKLATYSSEFGAGDVVIVPAAGGPVQRITTGAGVEIPLAWHPDGDRLYYYASAPGGTIASSVVSATTGVSSPTVPSETHPYAATIAPDATHIVFNQFNQSASTIWFADSAGKNPRQVTTEGLEQLTFPFNTWSPDGKQLAYESRRTGLSDIWVVGVDGGTPRQLTRDVRNDYDPHWSPDGKWIAFLSDRGKQTDVWVVPSSGGQEVRVTDDRNIEQAPLTWRPGTTTLAFVQAVQTSGVWALDLADGKERRLTPDSVRATYFNVSPDGTRIEYVVSSGGGLFDLVVAPLDGGPAKTILANVSALAGGRWSPDGSKILFTSDRGGSADPWVIDATGGEPRRLVNWPGADYNPLWSTDGSTVYFMSDHETKLGDAWSVPVGGGTPKRLTTVATIGGADARTGVPDLFLGTISESGGQFGIARLSKDGKFQVVLDKTNAFESAISPAGDSIAALVEQKDGKQLSMILSVKTGLGRTLLTPREQVISWSSDGKSLLYTTSRDGQLDIGILGLADGKTRELTKTPQDEFAAELTPNGKTVVFRRSQTIERIYTVDIAKLKRN